MTAPATKRRPKDTLALRLLGMRHELGLSQREASMRTGVPFGTWQGMESGRSTRDLAKHIQAISSELGYDRDWLMWGSQDSDGISTTTERKRRMMLRDSAPAISA